VVQFCQCNLPCYITQILESDLYSSQKISNLPMAIDFCALRIERLNRSDVPAEIDYGLLIQLRKLPAQLFQLGFVVKYDIRLVWMQGEIVLVVILGGIEFRQRHDLGNDGIVKGMR